MDKICKAIVVKCFLSALIAECSLSENREDDGFTCALGEIASELEIDFQTALKTVDYLVQTGYANISPEARPALGLRMLPFNSRSRACSGNRSAAEKFLTTLPINGLIFYRLSFP